MVAKPAVAMAPEGATRIPDKQPELKTVPLFEEIAEA